MGKYYLGTYYERHLPHYQPSGSTYFVIFRLVNSLPAYRVRELSEEYKRMQEQTRANSSHHNSSTEYLEQQNRYFQKFDSLLDKAQTGQFWLRNEKIAQIVYNSLLFNREKKYDLIAFTIMPNHVHAIITPLIKESQNSLSANYKNVEHNITDILRGIKRYTALEANKILHRSGTFWQQESYDHAIRNESSLHKLIKHVLNNPVKAGLCSSSGNWGWNYCKYL